MPSYRKQTARLKIYSNTKPCNSLETLKKVRDHGHDRITLVLKLDGDGELFTHKNDVYRPNGLKAMAWTH